MPQPPPPRSKADALESWVVDTDDIREIAELYARHISDVDDLDRRENFLKLLWIKLSGVPRLASLLLEYAELRRRSTALGESNRRRRGLGAFVRFLDANDARERRRGYVEDDPLYDRFLDA